MGLNEYTAAARAHWGRGAQAKAEETERCRWAIREAGLVPYTKPVEVRIEWVEGRRKNGAVRDLDNIRAGAKFILDALVLEGVIPNDSPRWVRGIYDTYKFNAEKPRVTVALDVYSPEGRRVIYAPITGVEEGHR